MNKVFTFLWRHFKAITLASVIFFVFLLTLFYFTNMFLSKSTTNRPTVVIPDLHGMRFDEAGRHIEQLSLNIAILDTEYSTLPAGVITSQMPSRGKKVFKNRTIQVIVSDGPKHVVVPNIIGFSLTGIDEVMRTYDLRIGNIVQHYSESVPAGQIMNVNPPPGRSVMAGSNVNLIISIGRDPLGIQEEVPPEILREFIFE